MYQKNGIFPAKYQWKRGYKVSIDKNIEILDMDFDMAEKSKTINKKITLDTN